MKVRHILALSQALVAFGLPLTASATSVVVITSQNLASYDLTEAEVSPNATLAGKGITGCSEYWVYGDGTVDSEGNGETKNFGEQETIGLVSYQGLSETALTTQLTGANPITFTECDGHTNLPGTYDSDLYSLSETFANMKAGIAPTQTCSKVVSCTGASCETINGVQTGNVEVVVQLTDSGSILSWETETVWGACN